MGCFCCFSSNESNVDRRRNGSRRSAQPPAYPPRNDHNNMAPQPENCKPRPRPESNDNKDARDHKEAANGSSNVIAAQTFTFRELAMATKNFRRECLIGEGGFGRVYKGKLDKGGQVVAVKQLDRNGLQGNREFIVEVLMLSLLHHQNLVNLVGYCADGDQRLLVYEYMPKGSLEDHLLEEGAEPAASFPSPPTMETLDSAKERQLAVEEAMEWGSNSRRMKSQSPRASAFSV
uniref:non-specific serine/threonine protein kinase n=1 Tax=Populus alba TaxID=43335 RepID=A0A4U5QP12_POPAL|nr:hypothetical protein D5086_0000066250 [Populus alba]